MKIKRIRRQVEHEALGLHLESSGPNKQENTFVTGPIECRAITGLDHPRHRSNLRQDSGPGVFGTPDQDLSV